MTRWHHVSCSAPDVVLDSDNWPSCRNCHYACPPLHLLLETQKNEGFSVLNLPPDEEPGNLNLWWPLTVPYVDSDGNRPARPEKTRKASEKTKGPMNNAPCYGDTLGSEKFRLALLPAVDREDYPIHITLETFTHDNHPEYETVSYLWGGENGDSSPSSPVFIGPFWDCYLHTKNCFSMLQFIRPWRGIRTLWIDALCINQHNLEERGAQVGNMSQIYGGCSRVIVYLGDDIVTTSTQFPSSRPLHEYEGGRHRAEFDDESHRTELSTAKSHPRLQKLLQRRYFSRIWMIQELLFSERALIRVGNVNYRADKHIMSLIGFEGYSSDQEGSQTGSDDEGADLESSQTWSDYEGSNGGISQSGPDNEDSHRKGKPTGVDNELASFSWKRSAAPWFQYLAHGKLPDIKSVADVLRYTLLSDASDPRDKLFGAMSLVESADLRFTFAPEYSLSFQQFCIGIFAHWLLVDHNFLLLYMARTLSRCTDSPSEHLPSWLPAFETQQSWKDLLATSSLPYQATGGFNGPSFDCVLSRILQEDRENANAKGLAADIRRLRFYKYGQLEETNARPWHQNSRIYSNSGVLSINLTHILVFKEPLSLLCTDAVAGSYFRINPTDESNAVASNADYLYLTSRERLDTVIIPGRDHLFVLDPANNDRFAQNPLIYLILRKEHPSNKESQRFRLVASDPFLFEMVQDLGQIVQDKWAVRPVFHRDIQRSVASSIDRILTKLLNKMTLSNFQKWADRLQAQALGSFDIAEMTFMKDQWEADHVIQSRGRITEFEHDEDMKEVIAWLAEIRDAYDPPLDLNTAVTMVLKGPTEEQKYIGVPKLVGGIKVDGSTYQVDIL